MNEIGQDIGMSKLIKKQVKPKNSSVVDHLLFCNHSTSYNKFLYSKVQEQKTFTRTEGDPGNNNTKAISTIVSVQQVLVT